MATQGISGRRGKLSFAASSVASASNVLEVTEYAITVEQPTADAASNDSSGWNEHLPMNRSWSLAYTIIPSSVSYSTATGGAAAWDSFMVSRSKRWMNLYATTGSTANRWRGYVVAESGEITGDLGDIMRMDFTYQGHGPLVYSS